MNWNIKITNEMGEGEERVHLRRSHMEGVGG